MTSHDRWVEYLGERAATAADEHHGALTEDGDGDPPVEEPTPLYDLTATALASAANSAANSAPAAQAGAGEALAAGQDAAGEDWLEPYGNPADLPEPTPVLDPDTPEGAAILRLFRRIKDIEESEGNWNGGDVVDALTAWFTELGIDPEAHPKDAGSQLRLALRDHPGGGLFSAVYGVRIGTEHDNPDPIIRVALHDLAAHLGPGTGIDLVTPDRAVLERIEQPVEPAGS